MREWLDERSVLTLNQVYSELTASVRDAKHALYDFIIVDEAQDISVAQLRLLAAMARKPDALFFAGDLGQRIFQMPFSWKSMGVNIQGRSSVLKINYQTSHQIRQSADKLLPGSISDVN